MVEQRCDDPAIADPVPPATPDHALQLLLERPQACDAFFDFRETLTSNGVDAGAWRFRLSDIRSRIATGRDVLVKNGKQ